jgi:3-phosphoshikimate 1-carboxyvinyltransferase
MSSRSIADLVKSTLFIRTFPCVSKDLRSVTTASTPDFLREIRDFCVNFAHVPPVRRVDFGPLRGESSLPGDKSISHRAAIVAAFLSGPTRIAGINSGRDVAATLNGLKLLGARIQRQSAGAVVVGGGELHPPAATIECANSGSTARMLLGACAGLGVAARFAGDASLSARPMEPVAAQLRAFGARIETAEGHLPMVLHATPHVQTRRFVLYAPSAQVKTALLFAGMFAGVPVTVTGDRGSRDHTERLLRYLGADLDWDGGTVTLRGGPTQTRDLSVPGDVSAACFLIVAGAIVPGSRVRLRDVGVNPTRTGALDALRAMGARIAVSQERIVCGEPVADLEVEASRLHGCSFDADLVLRAIDEIPLLAVAAAVAEGETTFAGVRELRVKESNRLVAVQQLLAAVGITAHAARDTLVVQGGTPTPPQKPIQTFGDHRIAMAAAVLGGVAGPIDVDGDAPAVSFPEFFQTLRRLSEPAR